MPAEETCSHRLPTNVCPSHYRLQLQINLTKCFFKGELEVDLKVNEPSNRIVLNADTNLEITEVSLLQNTVTHSPKYKINNDLTTLALDFDTTLPVGNAVLKIKYEAELGDTLVGLYRNKYTVDGEVRYSAVSQFEAPNARTCFPCWDEPALKATFDMTLVIPKDRVALSNMPEISREPYDGDSSQEVVKFSTTPVMSTYLLAVVVGEYDYVEKVSKNGVVIRTYTPVGKKEQGRFSVEVTDKILNYYEGYFGIKYPLPKLDLIAIHVLEAGAMENWGLITYREDGLLHDENNTSAIMKQQITEYIAHEVAHQWFGNLVTMEWWTHLWLNEGYASFSTYLSMDTIYPEYEMWTQFITSCYSSAMSLDSLKSSHAIEVPVKTAAEVNEIFDEISYNKGASVIKMLYNYIGDADFAKGMHLYLDKHKYKNAFTDDLWDALEEASGKPVIKIMSGWTRVVGFPMVSVTSKQDGEDLVLTFNQERFLSDSSATAEDKGQAVWMIPISMNTNGGKTYDYLLEGKTGHFVIPNTKETSWVKVNSESRSFFRTSYSPIMIKNLRTAISLGELSNLDIIGIISDLFSLVKIGGATTKEFLHFLTVFKSQTNYHVWDIICGCLAKLSSLFAYTKSDLLLQKFTRDLLQEIWSKVGWEKKPEEAALNAMLRATILSRLAIAGDDTIYNESFDRLQAHINGTAPLQVDIRGSVYRSVMERVTMSNNQKVFSQFVELFSASDLMEEKNRICRALGATTDPALIQKVIEFALSDKVTSVTSISILCAIGNSVVGRDIIWNYIKENIDGLVEKYKVGWLLKMIVKRPLCGFASSEKATDIVAFFDDKKVEGLENGILQVVESIKINANWLDRDADDTHNYLNTTH